MNSFITKVIWNKNFDLGHPVIQKYRPSIKPLLLEFTKRYIVPAKRQRTKTSDQQQVHHSIMIFFCGKQKRKGYYYEKSLQYRAELKLLLHNLLLLKCYVVSLEHQNHLMPEYVYRFERKYLSDWLRALLSSIKQSSDNFDSYCNRIKSLLGRKQEYIFL